ncbi:MAG TPA: helix-turn-helix transcriptional regulator [Amycolatopsis sp.]|nr:helix-turn-helix transcriptional regulator [Amycolatopsis sp.]
MPRARVEDPRLVAFGRALAGERRDRGFTLDELADASGISRRSISYLENGIVNPRLTTVVDLARGLGIDIARLTRPLMDVPRR